MNIHKFISGPEKPFHSHGYAEVANSGLIGSTNTQSFGERYQVDQNRRAVRKYRDSYIGQGALHGHGHARARAAVNNPLRQTELIQPTRQKQDAQSIPPRPIHPPVVPPSPRPTFKEPPTRSYNPYK